MLGIRWTADGPLEAAGIDLWRAGVAVGIVASLLDIAIGYELLRGRRGGAFGAVAKLPLDLELAVGFGVPPAPLLVYPARLALIGAGWRPRQSRQYQGTAGRAEARGDAMKTQPGERFHERHAWLIPLGVGSLLSLSALAIVVSGANPPPQFETDTGVPWADFERDYPTVATLVSLQELLLGTGFFGFALLATLIAAAKLRAGDRWAWYVMWILPGILTVAAVLFLTHEQGDVGAFYGAAAILAALGLVLPVRKFLQR